MMPSEIPDIAQEMSDSSSQHSNKDFTTSPMDSDVEGDTLVSQLTAATEMTLPLQSAAALVSLLPMLCRSTHWRYYSAGWKSSSSFTRCTVQSPNESDQHTNVTTPDNLPTQPCSDFAPSIFVADLTICIPRNTRESPASQAASSTGVETHCLLGPHHYTATYSILATLFDE